MSKRLTKAEKVALAQKAAHHDRLPMLAEEADRALAEDPTEAWKTLGDHHKEVIVYRLHAGETLSQACRSMKVQLGTVLKAAYLDPEFGERIAIAKSIGAHVLVDRLLEIPNDETLTVERSKLLSDNIKWVASRLNRVDYGDKLAIDARIQNVPVMLPIEAIAHDDKEGL